MSEIAEKIKFDTTEEWLSYREQRIGGSSIATLLGLNKYETPYKLWEQMTGKVPPFTGNASTERGQILEPAIVEWLSKKVGWEIDPDTNLTYVYQHNEHPFIIGSPDREAWAIVGTADDGLHFKDKRIVEIKTTRMQVTRDTVPDTWVVQVNHYMGLSGIHKGVIAWLSGSLEFDYIDVEFNQELFDIGLNAACDFMFNNVYANIPPEVNSGDDVSRAYPVHVDGKALEATDSIVEMVREISVLRDRVKDHETNLKEKEDQLKILMGDNETVTYMGEKIATFKFQKGRTMFDSKTFKAEHPELYDRYEKEGNGYRVLRIHNQ
mgnify:CR=1 FL=1